MGRSAAVAALACCVAAGCGDNLVHPEWWADSDRMRVRAWATESGYRYMFGWRDQVLDAVCDAGAPACAPLVQAYYADAACRELVASSVQTLPPIGMFRDSRGGHGVRVNGAPFSGPLYFRRAGCRLAGTSDPNFHYVRAERFDDVVAPEVEELELGARYLYPDLAYVALADASAIAEAEAFLDVHIEGGPNRLRTRYLLDGGVALAAGIHDADHAVACTPALDPAGALRCVPRLAVPVYAAGSAYSDAACSQPLDHALYAAPGFAAADDGYLRIDTPVTSNVHLRAGTECVTASTTAHWRAGATLPAAAFVAMFVEEVAR